jgi:hypothetical protein
MRPAVRPINRPGIWKDKGALPSRIGTICILLYGFSRYSIADVGKNLVFEHDSARTVPRNLAGYHRTGQVFLVGCQSPTRMLAKQLASLLLVARPTLQIDYEYVRHKRLAR